MASGTKGLNAQMEAQQRELRRAVHAFNEKIRYHRNKGTPDLPEKIKIRDVVSRVDTDEDYDREVSRLRRFGKKGAEKAVKVNDDLDLSTWELEELQRSIENVNREKEKQREAIGELPLKSRGKKLGYKKKQMPDNQNTEFNQITVDITKKRYKSEIRALTKAIREQEQSGYFNARNEMMLDNYLQSLRTVYGSRADAIINKIRAMPKSKALKIMFSDTEGSIKFNYDKHLGVDSKLEAVSAVWGVKYIEPEDDEEFEI